MKFIKKVLYIVILVCSSTSAYAQELDSLMQIFRNQKTLDSTKLSLIRKQHIDYLIFRKAHNQPDSAISYSKSLLDFAKSRNHKFDMVIAYDISGAAYMFKGDHLTALDWFLKSLEVKESMNDTIKRKDRALVASFTNLGELYLDEKMYDDAFNYFLKSLKLSKKIDDEQAMVIAIHNMGSIYMMQNKYDLAEEEFFKGMYYSNEGGRSKFDINIYLCSLGDLYFEMGNTNKAVDFYKRSLIANADTENLAIINSSIGLGKAYLWQADSIRKADKKADNKLYIEAIKHNGKALQLAQESGFLKETAVSSENLYKIYKTLSNTSKSLEMHEAFVKSSDSLKKLDAEKEILRLRYKDEYEKEKLKSQLELREKTLKRNVLFALILIVFICSIGYLYFKTIKNKKEKKSLLNEIDILKSNAVLQYQNNSQSTEKPELDKDKIESFIGGSLNPTDWSILNHLYENPSLTAKELGNKISLSTQGVYSSLKKMYRLFDLQQKNENQRLALVVMSLKVSGYSYFNN